VEHNLEVIQSADWVIDIGPEAGEGGGKIVCEGPPEDLVIHAEQWQMQQQQGRAGELLRSHTGEALRAFAAPATTTAPRGPSSRRAGARSHSC